MDEGIIIREQPTELNIEEFNQWITSNLIILDDICKVIKNESENNKEEIKDYIDYHARCMVQFTRQMCFCDQRCVDESFKDVILDTNCHIKDREFLTKSQDHLPCNNFDIRVLAGAMHKITDINFPKINSDIIVSSFNNLCFGGYDYFEDAQCAAYELKDECGSDKECLKMKSIPLLLPSDCPNIEFKNQIREIEDIIGFRDMNTTFEDLQVYMMKPSTFEIEHLDELNPEFLVQESNNTTLSSIVTFSVPFLFVSLLGFMAYKLFKKKTKIDTIRNEANTEV